MSATSPVSSTAPSWLLVDNDDPIGRLEEHIGKVVEYFGPHAREMIKTSMDQDQMNSENLRKMEADLRNAGDSECADRIVKHVRTAAMHSFKQVRPMRRHIQDIADLLNEIMDPQTLTDEESMRAILLGVHESADKACEIARAGQEKYEELAEELASMQGEYKTRMVKAKQDCQEQERVAQCKAKEANAQGWSSAVSGGGSVVSSMVPLGKGGLGVVALSGGAEALASVPLIGSALTSTTTSYVTTQVAAGGLWGFFGGTVPQTVAITTVAFNPVGIMVGVACAAGFGILAVKCAADASQSNAQKETALAERAVAEKRAAECTALVENSEKSQQIATKMASSAGTHGRLWFGVSQSAEAAAQVFQSLSKIDPRKRRPAFDKKMDQYILDLSNMVQAIDEYLFYLDKTGYAPPNYGCASVVGPKRYAELTKQWAAAAAQVRDRSATPSIDAA